MVCDLTTTNNFWANGFIVHNSYGVNLPNFRAVIRDVKRYYPGIGSIYLPVLEVEQMFWEKWKAEVRCLGRRGF